MHVYIVLSACENHRNFCKELAVFVYVTLSCIILLSSFSKKLTDNWRCSASLQKYDPVEGVRVPLNLIDTSVAQNSCWSSISLRGATCFLRLRGFSFALFTKLRYSRYAQQDLSKKRTFACPSLHEYVLNKVYLRIPLTDVKLMHDETWHTVCVPLSCFWCLLPIARLVCSKRSAPMQMIVKNLSIVNFNIFFNVQHRTFH